MVSVNRNPRQIVVDWHELKAAVNYKHPHSAQYYCYLFCYSFLADRKRRQRDIFDSARHHIHPRSTISFSETFPDV